MTTASSEALRRPLPAAVAAMIAAAALTGVNAIVLAAHETTPVLAAVLTMAASVALGFFAYRQYDALTAVAVLVAATIFVVNQLLWLHRYLTVLNSAALFAEQHVGWFAARFIALVLLILVLTLAFHRRRPWLYVVAAVLIAGSWPSRLSDAFFI